MRSDVEWLFRRWSARRVLKRSDRAPICLTALNGVITVMGNRFPAGRWQCHGAESTKEFPRVSTNAPGGVDDNGGHGEHRYRRHPADCRACPGRDIVDRGAD